MQELNLFLIFIKPLAELKLDYMITGSVAATLYGEPRLTHDVDVLLEITTADVKKFSQAFSSDEFYCPPEEVIRTELNRERRGHFNLIHHETGFKADIYLCGEEPIHIWGLEHAKTVDIDGVVVRIAPPEYVIVKKLLFFREGGSQKHMRDIQAMLSISGAQIKKEEIQRWVAILGLSSEWNSINKE
jgi:hypothetical protein